MAAHPEPDTGVNHPGSNLSQLSDPSWILTPSPPHLFFLGSGKSTLLHLQQQLFHCCFILIQEHCCIWYWVKPHILISSLDFRNFSKITAQSLMEIKFHHQSLLNWFKLFRSKRKVVCKIRTSFWYFIMQKKIQRHMQNEAISEMANMEYFKEQTNHGNRWTNPKLTKFVNF